ncbi:MAG: M28 family peptidase [Fidelibacterota bacterium]|nr:MAG: M28 family peptidase [Candidatus Neomarinimicrobiota bacterium]
MKSIIATWVMLLSLATLSAQDYDPHIAKLMNQTNLDSLVSIVRILSGEDSVRIADSTGLIEHRVAGWGNDLAGDYIKQTLAGYGLETYDQIYSETGRNIYAIQPGTVDPDRQYILCAHYDAVTYYCADDNASGVAAVLEAARIFSTCRSNYTIIYALWDEEEVGLIGSSYFACQADSDSADIRGVINLDMLAWDGNGDNVIELHADTVANSASLANRMVNIDSVYNLSLDPLIYNSGATASDHSSFWDLGYGAVLLIEGYWAGDFNPYYHSIGDRIDKFDLPYFHDMARLAIGALASLVFDTTATYLSNTLAQIPQDFQLYNFPNPFNPATTIRYQLPELADVILAIYDIRGRTIMKLAEGDQSAGWHEILWDGTETHGIPVSTGVYFCRLQAGNSSRIIKMSYVK